MLGPGGVGGLIAALLARAGGPVLVLAGDDTARVIDSEGLRLESRRFGDFQVQVRTANRLDEPVDVCFITVKATQLEEALQRVPASALGDALVIPLLNGLDHMELLRSVYGKGSVVAATIRVEAVRTAPGLIRQSSPFAAMELAATSANSVRVEKVAAHLKATGLDVTVREDEAAMLWAKFALLAPMALLTTHERANLGVVRRKRREDVIAVIAEVAAVARAEGVSIEPDALLRMVDSVHESMESSMQRDQAAGRPIELEALGAAIVKRAARAGIQVPVTSRLVEELRGRAGSSLAST